MDLAIEYLKSTINPPKENGILRGDLMHYLQFRYAGNNPTIPLKLKISLTFSIENIAKSFLYEQTITSEFTVSKIVSMDNMYKAHLKVREVFQKELDKSIKEDYRQVFTLPTPPLTSVVDSMKDANLFDHLVIGFSKN